MTKKIVLIFIFFFAFFLFSNLKAEVVWANPWRPCCYSGSTPGCQTYDPNTGWSGVCVNEPWQCNVYDCGWWGSCSSSCNGTQYYYCTNNGCGGTITNNSQSCNPAPAAQSCPTTCHTNTQYVSNGSCGQTTCGPNAPAAQSCPTTCHTNTVYVPNGSCGQTACGSNAPAAQACPTSCHTNTQYVSNGACGTTTCAPNAGAAGTCPTTCHTNTQYVSNGACGTTTCAPNAGAAQSCPTTCGYAGGTVPDGSCGTIACPAITPSCYFSGTTVNASAGVVSSGRILGFDGNIATKMSVPQWQVADGSENLASPVYDYNYFYQKMGSPAAVNFTGKLNEIVSGTTVYYSGVSLANLQGNWSNYNQSAVIFVNGDLNINTQILAPIGKFLAFIVSGNIRIDSTIGTTATGTVSTVEGVYLANGTIDTSTGDGVSHAKFVGRGMFLADANLDGVGGFNLQRTLGESGNPFYPAEYFEYRPDLLVNFPSQLGVRRISWKEVAP